VAAPIAERERSIEGENGMGILINLDLAATIAPSTES